MVVDPHLAPAALFLAAGLVLGLAHFTTLRRVVALYGAGAPLSALLLQAARLLAVAAVLVFAAHRGVVPVLTATSGIFLARLLVIHPRKASAP